jgi:hypothetical protein
MSAQLDRLAIQSRRFGGGFTLKYEGDVNDPAPAAAKCVEATRQAWSRVTAAHP